RPTAGAIEVDGVDVIRHPRRVRDRIGYMGQKVSLYEGLTLGENVEFYAGLYGLAGAELTRRWGALRARFALAEAEGAPPEELPRRYSGGYRVEVALPPGARAAAAALLGGEATLTEAGLALAGGPLDTPVLGALARLVAAHPEARVSIEQPAMTDVFRRVLAEAGAAR